MYFDYVKEKKIKELKEEIQKLKSKKKNKPEEKVVAKKKQYGLEGCGLTIDTPALFRRGLVSEEEMDFLLALKRSNDPLTDAQYEKLKPLSIRVLNVICNAPEKYKDPSYVFENAYDVVVKKPSTHTTKSNHLVNRIHASKQQLNKPSIYIFVIIAVLLFIVIGIFILKMCKIEPNNEDLFTGMNQCHGNGSMKVHSTMPSHFNTYSNQHEPNLI